MQAIPRNNSEVFLESTSDGMGNYFHQTWIRAVAGTNGFEAVFIPWFWQSEYEIHVEGEVSLDEDEVALLKRFGENEDEGKRLTVANLLWRREKTSELADGAAQFKREYPNDAQEAFESAGYRQLISAEDVSRAIRNRMLMNQEGKPLIEPRGPLVMGVDPARFGDDRLSIALRQGRVAFDVEAYPGKKDQMEIVGICRQILDSAPIDRCFIDEGMGVGVIDRLHELGYYQVRGVNFGANAFNRRKYSNRRNEMWQEMAEWFDDDHVQLFTPTTENVEMKIEAATLDLCGPEYKFSSRNTKELEPKDKTKERIGMSPDMGDSLALTFAEPVAEYWDESPGKKHEGRNPTTGY